jgi:hypothetical protein
MFRRERRTKPHSVTPDHVEPVELPDDQVAEIVIDLTRQPVPDQRAMPTD